MTIVASKAEAVRPKSHVAANTSVEWRELMKRAIRDPAELCRRLRLPEEFVAPAERAAAAFGLFVPEPYLSRIEPGNPADPLLRQVLPLGEELGDVPGYTIDPVADADARQSAGLLHKYRGRALLVTTGACAIHCRYCFRRHYPYSDSPQGIAAWSPALDAIAADPTIDEVILSGGDPWTLSDVFLAQLTEGIARIEHVRRVRVHTRLPVVIPQRVTDALIDVLRSTRLAPIVVIHANHPREVDDAVAVAIGRLVDAGVVVLNQAVLLRGVNDNAATLAELCRTLVNLRVMPYYLHRLDRVAGAAHFDVPLELGRRIVERLRAELPGYAVPRFVEEIAGESSKVALS